MPAMTTPLGRDVARDRHEVFAELGIDANDSAAIVEGAAHCRFCSLRRSG